jgi:hypothetical protein
VIDGKGPINQNPYSKILKFMGEIEKDVVM